MLPSSLVPSFLAFESLLFGLPASGDFLLFEHFGVPNEFPLGKLLPGQRLTGSLAPDVKFKFSDKLKETYLPPGHWQHQAGFWKGQLRQ